MPKAHKPSRSNNMPDLHSLASRLYYTNRRAYTKREGNVAYLDATPLQRPMSMPASQRILAAVVVAAAIILGFLFVNATVLSSIREAAQVESAITNNLNRQASIETVPVMTELVTLSDDEIRNKFTDSGFAIYEDIQISDSDDMVLYKLPDDMSVDAAAALFSRGISSLTAPQATELLNGSWYFSSERSGTTSMVVRYADFSTGDPHAAVATALEKEGFDPTAISESGVDDSGNTYNMGVVEVDGKAYTWKISALPLSEMYAINNMPEDACYVGIRLTAQ